MGEAGSYLPRTISPATLRWDSPGLFVLRELRTAIAESIRTRELAPAARVLDYGCALQPYRGLLPEHADYWGADLPGNAGARVFINADGTLPVESESFDLVLSTQVLEHVVDPRVYLKECSRVLKPGGSLILSTHGMWRYHEDPVDYWRWTGPGLAFDIQRAGFTVERLEGVMGLAGVAVQTFQDATLHRLPRFCQRWYGVILQRLVALFDRLETPESRRRDAMVFVVLARRG